MGAEVVGPAGGSGALVWAEAPAATTRTSASRGRASRTPRNIISARLLIVWGGTPSGTLADTIYPLDELGVGNQGDTKTTGPGVPPGPEVPTLSRARR